MTPLRARMVRLLELMRLSSDRGRLTVGRHRLLAPFSRVLGLGVGQFSYTAGSVLVFRLQNAENLTADLIGRE